MRFSLWKSVILFGELMTLVVIWKLLHLRNEIEMHLKRRSSSPQKCHNDVMWKIFDNMGDMSFPWKPVDELYFNSNLELDCGYVKTISRVNMSLVPPSITPVKEVMSFERNVTDLINDAKFHYFVMNAKAFPFTKEGLPSLVPTKCRSDPGLKIPNIVHFIWNGDMEFGEVHYLSLRSVGSMHGPTLLLLHVLEENMPVGQFWEQAKNDIPCLQLNRLSPGPDIGSNSSIHQNNYQKLKILQIFGGIVADIGTMVFKPLDNIMNESAAIGEDHGLIKNSVIMSEPNSMFINSWISTFKNYSVVFPQQHTSYIPQRIINDHPEHGVKVINNRLTRPSYKDGFKFLTNKNMYIGDNYCASLYYQPYIPASLPLFKLNISSLVHLDSTYGQMVRMALYGRFDLEVLKREKNKYERMLSDTMHVECSDEFIPRILHFIITEDYFSFNNYISTRLALKNLKPYKVMFHKFTGGKKIDSHLFSKLQREVQCLEIKEIPNLNFQYINVFKSNIKKRLEVISSILMQYGGIYLNENVLIIKPLASKVFDNLVTIPKQELADDTIATSFLATQKESRIISKWLDGKASRSLYQTGIQSFIDLKGVIQEDIIQPVNEYFIYSTTTLPDNGRPMYLADKSTVNEILYENQDYNEILSSDTIYGKIAKLSFI